VSRSFSKRKIFQKIFFTLIIFLINEMSKAVQKLLSF